MVKHFERLWEESENLFKEEVTPLKMIIMEMKAKLSVYEALDESSNLSPEEKKKLKSHTFGRILANLTQISLQDNINSFAALNSAINDVKIDQLEIKYNSEPKED